MMAACSERTRPRVWATYTRCTRCVYTVCVHVRVLGKKEVSDREVSGLINDTPLALIFFYPSTGRGTGTRVLEYGETSCAALKQVNE